MDDPLRVAFEWRSDRRVHVLILVVMDDPLRGSLAICTLIVPSVLILVVMDDPLRDNLHSILDLTVSSLNPCCNG